jgi:hypothetical protein
MMRLRITVGFAALALATAFASAPAFAAQGIPGHSSDGAVVAVHHHRHHSGARPLYYNYNPGYGGSSGGPYNYSGYVSGQPGPSSGIESQR